MKVCIVGGGTAGWIAASVIKSYFNTNIDLTLIQSSSIGVIGVGESTTDIMRQWSRITNISFEDLIRETGSTLKTGIRFEDWKHKGHLFYHNFNEAFDLPPGIKETNLVFAYDLANDLNSGSETYSPRLSESNKIPMWENEQGELIQDGTFTLHIDAYKFSKFIEHKFKDRITVIDSEVVEVVKNKNDITKLILSNTQEIQADIFIDASGMAKVLSKSNQTFCNINDILLNNSAWTCQVGYKENEKVPNYTNAKAHEYGWVWTIPLADRYGTGWVYSNNHCDKDTAEKKFKEHLEHRHNTTNVDLKHISFIPGYLEQPWQNNCVNIGLSSGFIEPLEATNIHMIVGQSIAFVRYWQLEQNEIKRQQYNSSMVDMWKQAIEVVRLHYVTDRTDTTYWQQLTNNIPSNLQKWIDHWRENLVQPEDIHRDFDRQIGYRVFGLHSYGEILRGLGIQTKKVAKKYLKVYNLTNTAEEWHTKVMNAKNLNFEKYIDHTEFVRNNVK